MTRKGPKGNERFIRFFLPWKNPQLIPTILPNTELIKIVVKTPDGPTNDPSIASNLISPPPRPDLPYRA
jgi:hypothetical protein